MQFKMSYPTNDKTGNPAASKTAANATKPKPKKSSKSQPLDPEDLRRRLLFVLAEQNAKDVMKRRMREKAKAKALAEASVNERSVGYPRPTATATEARSHDKSGDLPARERHRSNAAEKSREVKKPHEASLPSKKAADSSAPKTRAPRPEQSAEKLKRKPSKDDPSSAPPPRKSEEALGGAGKAYVPQQAASQFSRTATAENMRDKNVHALSRPVLKYHLERFDWERDELAASGTTPAQQRKTIQKALSQRQKLSTRNQFQDPKIKDESLEADIQALKSRLKRHTFPNSNLGLSMSPPDDRGMKDSGRFADAIPEDDWLIQNELAHADESGEEMTIYKLIDEHRVDWSQSDEMAGSGHKTAKLSLLKKADSIMALKGRMANRGRQAQDGGESEDQCASPTSPKSLRANFFSKFKL